MWRETKNVLEEISARLARIEEALNKLSEKFEEMGNRHLKLVDEINDTLGDLADGETFLGEIKPNDN